MKNSIGTVHVLSVLFLLLPMACTPNYDEITAKYREESSGSTLLAVYRNFSDGSLSTVTLTFPDGKVRNLSQGMAASGARYTDEKTLTWWTKGEGAFMEVFDQGDWRIAGRYVEVSGE